jgi:putative redox protein
VAEVEMSIRLPYELPPGRRDGLLAVAGHCTVHNSITTTPNIVIELT